MKVTNSMYLRGNCQNDIFNEKKRNSHKWYTISLITDILIGNQGKNNNK